MTKTKPEQLRRIAVIGAGAWGTTLAILSAEKGNKTSLWVFENNLMTEIENLRENRTFLPGFQLPKTITITNDLKETAASDIIIFAVPTQYLRSIAKKASSNINPNTIIACANKGIEENTLKLPSDIIEEMTKSKKIAVISGPNLSKEIAQEKPAATVVASKSIEIAKAVQKSLMLSRVRVYTNTDPLGTQLGGALKNIIAIAAGVADGLELGNNAKAGLMIRGFAEISRLGIAMGAKPETFAGLSGMGDLITTCSSKLSRNHSVGEQLAKGKKISKILKAMKEVAEGVPSTKAALALGKKHKIHLPIIQEVYNLLYEGKDPYQAITDLMTRSATKE